MIVDGVFVLVCFVFVAFCVLLWMCSSEIHVYYLFIYFLHFIEFLY